MQQINSENVVTESVALPSTITANCDWESIVDEAVSARVEDYLERACHPLIHTHSYFERKSIRQELRQHIYSLFQAYLEMGVSPINAVDNALLKFGDANQVARQWQTASGVKHIARSSRWFKSPRKTILALMALCTVTVALASGLIAMREIKSQQLMVRQQIAARNQSVAMNSHLTVPLSHESFKNISCGNCHRGDFTHQVQALSTQPSFFENRGAGR